MECYDKIVLKLNCGDSNAPVLAENLPFLKDIFGLLFSLNIFLVFGTLPSYRKVMFSLFNQSFQHDFFAVFSFFSVVSQPFFPFGILA